MEAARRLLARSILAIAVAVAGGAVAFAGTTALPAHPVAARLIPETKSVAPGETLWVDVDLAIIPGWHIYWRNPGDSGLPTEIAWTLPAGFTAGAILWPVPEHLVIGTFGNYAYTKSAELLVPIVAPKGLAAGGVAHLAANASWAVCSDVCIPGAAKLTLDVPVRAGPAAPDPAVAARFAAARARLPKPAGFAATYTVSGRALRLSIPSAAVAGLGEPQASFYPFAGNVLDAASKPKAEPRADGLDVVLARASGPTAALPAGPEGALDGVLVLRGKGGAERAYAIAAARTAGPAP